MADIGEFLARLNEFERIALVQPATRVRYRRAGGGRGGEPQYPAVTLAIDYLLPDTFSGPLSLAITDAQGRSVRTVESPGPGRRGGGPESRGRGSDAVDPEMRSGAVGRGRGMTAALTTKAGHNRFLWDYRWGNNGPMAAPGKYTVTLSAGTAERLTRTFEVHVDPDVLKDGITIADLVEQQNFLLAVRDAIAQATQLRERVQAAMQKANVPMPPSPGPGQSVANITYQHPLQRIWARLVTAPGIYEQGMLIDQLGNIVRAEGGADQKVGAESRRRFDDLMKELKMLEGAVK